MSSALEIRPIDSARVWEVLDGALPPDARVYVFGSRATGRAKRGSDLDLAIDAGRALSAVEAGRIADGFEESDLPYRVDVIDLQSASAEMTSALTRDRVELPRAIRLPATDGLVVAP